MFVEIFVQIRVRTRLKKASRPKWIVCEAQRNWSCVTRDELPRLVSAHTRTLLAGVMEASGLLAWKTPAAIWCVVTKRPICLCPRFTKRSGLPCMKIPPADNLIDQRNEPQNAHLIFHLLTDSLSLAYHNELTLGCHVTTLIRGWLSDFANWHFNTWNTLLFKS